MRSFTSYVSAYDSHVGTLSIGDLPRDQQDDLIRRVFDADFEDVNGGVKSCHAAAQKSATCGARMRPPGGLRPERGSHARVAIFEGRQPAFRARLWARR